MTPAAFLTLLALQAPAHDGDRDRGRPTETCPADVVARFDRLDDALRHLGDELEDTHGRRHRRGEHVREDLALAMRRSQEARVEACRAARREVVVAPRPPPPPPPPVLDEGHARELVRAVRKEAFDDSRLSVLALGVNGVCVTAPQADTLVRLMTFSKARIDALRTLTPRIVDRQDALRLLDAFTFDSDKRAAREILGTAPPAPECVPPRRL